MIQRRYLITPPAGFCAPFVVWAFDSRNAIRICTCWLGVHVPEGTTATTYSFNYTNQN